MLGGINVANGLRNSNNNNNFEDYNQYQDRKQGINRNTLLIVCCIAVIIVSIGVILFFLFSGYKIDFHRGNGNNTVNQKTFQNFGECDHDWWEATCETPRTCVKCGKTDGSPLGHDWEPATYSSPQTCRRCGLAEGFPLPDKSDAITFLNDHIIDVTATTTLSEGKLVHYPERIIDGDITTAWVEGAEGNGYGETITLEFDAPFSVTSFKIYSGYQLDEKRYYNNARPEEMTVSFSDGTTATVYIYDMMGAQEIVFDSEIETRYISFTIDSVYSGSKCTDTCISEIEIYGY